MQKSFISPPPRLSFPVSRSNINEMSSINAESPIPKHSPLIISDIGSDINKAVPKKIKIPANCSLSGMIYACKSVRVRHIRTTKRRINLNVCIDKS